MKILFEAKSPLVRFTQLQPGEVFRHEGEDDAFMVVFEDSEPVPGHLQSNAVNLKTGELHLFGDVLVERVHAVLHIK